MKMSKLDAQKFIVEIKHALVIANPTYFDEIQKILDTEIHIIQMHAMSHINVEFNMSHVLMRIFQLKLKDVSTNPQSF